MMTNEATKTEVNTLAMHETGFEMSNFGHKIDEGMSEALKSEPGQVSGRHCGWNFNGRVYYHCGLFHEQVWVYGIPRKTISAETLEDLMVKVNTEYGAD